MKTSHFYLIILSITAFIFMALSSYNKNSSQHYAPKDGFVPNQETAVKIAEAIWLPIYGNSILEMKPFKVQLQDSSVWIVQGTLPIGMKGGVPYIEIRKKDCKILKVSHGK